MFRCKPRWSKESKHLLALVARPPSWTNEGAKAIVHASPSLEYHTGTQKTSSGQESHQGTKEYLQKLLVPSQWNEIQ
ncbi:hypothetical protein M513_06509, partial [Trichuris suis]